MPAAAEDPLASPSLPRRLVGMGYEALLLFGLLIVTLIFPHILIGAFAHRLATGIVLWTHLFLVLLIYFVGFWSHGGQTLAMKTWQIRLVSDTGQPVRPVQALLRYLLCWPSVGLLGIGVLWSWFDHEGQFLHDRMAGTRLITTTPQKKSPPLDPPDHSGSCQQE